MRQKLAKSLHRAAHDEARDRFDRLLEGASKRTLIQRFTEGGYRLAKQTKSWRRPTALGICVAFRAMQARAWRQYQKQLAKGVLDP